MYNEMNEKCGIFGVYGQGLEAARLTHPGLFALQHRGQESSGIVSSTGESMYIHRGRGLVAHVYSGRDLDVLPGHIAIGHNRYSTSKGSTPEHNQPVVRPLAKDGEYLALAHNGNLPTTNTLERFLLEKNVDISSLNDSEMMAEAIRYYLLRGSNLSEAVLASYPLFNGAFSLLCMTKDELTAVRDPCGIRPLSMATINGGVVFSSETCALDTIGANFERDVLPGEMVSVSASGVESIQIMQGCQRLDLFEFVYFARPDSILLGQRVNEVRRRAGMKLAEESFTEADVVIPVPDSAIPVAEGFSERSGIIFRHGLIKNRYIHRTFIEPEQHLREKDVEMKLIPIPEVLRGRRVVVLDDSIIRGTTQLKLLEILRRAGAKEVHVRISSPPVRYPDFYGIDTPKQRNLIAATRTVEEIREFIKADSLSFLSFPGLIEATGVPEDMFCTSCFTGQYPIDIGERARELMLAPV